MRFDVLGPLEVRDRGHAVDLGAGKPAILLSALLLNANAWVSVDRLVMLTWQRTAAPASAVRNISTFVWQLRKLLGAGRIEGRSGAYLLRTEPAELDALRLEQHGEAAEAARLAGDLAEELAQLEAARLLWRGDPYQELGAAGAVEAERLRELHLTLRADHAHALLRAGRYAAAVGILRGLTSDDPLRERPWELLVRALHRTGRRAEAVAAFRRARAVLADELGVAPGPELVAAHHDAVQDTSPLTAGELAAVSGVDIASVERVLACLRGGTRQGAA